jgi:hypothetical protein
MITGLLMTLSLAGALYTVRLSMTVCAWYQLGGRDQRTGARYTASIILSTAVTIGAAFLGGYLL